jgi:hypothetical protein
MAGAALRVCTVLEPGFSHLAHGVASAAEVASDAQLKGYDVDVRASVLSGYSYTISAFENYGEVMVRTRAGECDIGWANYFYVASRMSCDFDAATCLPLDADSAAGTVESWTPYRCCVDYSMNVWPNDIIAFRVRDEQQDFFSAFFTMVTSPFFINFISFAFIWALIFAHGVWLAERQDNSAHYPKNYLDGIDDAMWWAIVTFTTVRALPSRGVLCHNPYLL